MALSYELFGNGTSPYYSGEWVITWADTGITDIDWRERDYKSIRIETKNKIPEGIEMKTMYNVYLVYGEDRKKPVIHKQYGVIANSKEDAKIKSGLMKDINETWDEDYLTFIVEEIGEVKIKEKPKEVKSI